MSVITDKSEVSLQTTGRCTFCGGYLYHPFVEWHGSPEDPEEKGFRIITICGRCCERYSKGLQADLLQIGAIIELERLYPGFTFVREYRGTHERRAAQQQSAEDALIAEVVAARAKGKTHN
jgi:hypothetical protein